jgi:hypothetical protein
MTTNESDTAKQGGTNLVSGRVQTVVALFGAALSTAGAVAVFTTDNSAGAGSLVATGAVGHPRFIRESHTKSGGGRPEGGDVAPGRRV